MRIMKKKYEKTLNVNKIMHENAVIEYKTIEDEKFQVSALAVHEYTTRVREHIQNYMPLICEITKKHGRKTVTDDDVVEFFGFVGRDIINEKEKK